MSVVRAGVGVLGIGLSACLNEGLPQTPTPDVTQVSVAGVVSDAAQNPVDAAVVQLTTQAGTFQATTSDAQGRYALSGYTVVAGTITVRASKAGLATASQTRQVPAAGGAIQIDFTLDPAAPPAPPIPPIFDLAGEHTLTITADAACETLPAEARSRTYLASVTPAAFLNTFDIRLSGASFLRDHDRMFASVVGAGSIYVATPDELTVIELLGDGTRVEHWGQATPIGGWSNDITARFSGSIGHCPAGGAVANPLVCKTAVSCTSTSHQLRLTRR